MSSLSKFLKRIEKTAKSTDDAIKAGLLELGVSERDVDVEIIEEGTKGFLGIGAKEAKVVLSVKDPNAVNAKKFLADIFGAMNMEVNIDAQTSGSDSLSVNLSGDDMGIIIGKRGDTLDSIQYLTSLIVNQETDDYVKVTVDTENYREKRTNALLQLSERLAAKVVKTGKKYTLEPMNPYERRVIHANLQENTEVTTYSIGEDPYRKIVIAPKNPKPYFKKSYDSSSNAKRPAPRPTPRPSSNYRHPQNPNKKASFDEIAVDIED